ncbi:MAG: hypothetical protein ACRDP7_13780, partial [Trebonia sp.]
IKAAQRARGVRHERAVEARLNAVLAHAEREQRERRAAAKASAALTAVLPAISQEDQEPRRVA